MAKNFTVTRSEGRFNHDRRKINLMFFRKCFIYDLIHLRFKISYGLLAPLPLVYPNSFESEKRAQLLAPERVIDGTNYIGFRGHGVAVDEIRKDCLTLAPIQ